MDWNSFLRSDEFREYRKRQMLLIAKNIKSISAKLATKSDPELSKLNGKLEMIHLFLRFPESLTDSKELQEVLRLQLDDDINGITQSLLRETLRDDKS